MATQLSIRELLAALPINPIMEYSIRELLERYTPENDNDISRRLRELSKDRPCIVFRVNYETQHRRGCWAEQLEKAGLRADPDWNADRSLRQKCSFCHQPSQPNYTINVDYSANLFNDLMSGWSPPIMWFDGEENHPVYRIGETPKFSPYSVSIPKQSEPW